MRLEGLGKLKKCNNLIGTRTHDLLACSYQQPMQWSWDDVFCLF
jgi:hypothetical protein